ncbi:MAG TPA: YraN family protein [Candidatus Dormibacteraeota bacterium]|nr:YraN family protein [Candidatus Dormibacteraeota bacterium]
MGATRVALGRAGEAAAEEWLCRAGMRLVERDVRLRNGQIDLVMLDGERLVMVEVKARRGGDYGLPQEAVTWRKLAKLRELAETYCLLHPHIGVGVRIDVVAVELDRSGVAQRVVHIPAVSPRREWRT